MARFDCAVWRPISGGTSGPLTAQRGLVLHHAVAVGSLWGTFNNGAVSTQFWVSRSGVIEQYLDSSSSAWATGSNVGNFQYCSVETEGCNTSPYAEPMTDAMVNALAALYAEGNRRHGWPFILADSAGANGFAYHRLFFNTACPCDVRINRRQDILNIARGATPPTQEVGMFIVGTPTGKGYYAAKADGSLFAFGDANYSGGINNAAPGGKSAMPAGQSVTSLAACQTGGYWMIIGNGAVYAFGGAPYFGNVK